MFDLPLEILYLLPIVVIAYTTNAMIGFGAPLVAVTLGANFIPIELLVPSLVPLSVIVPGIIAFRHRREVHTGLLLKQILPLMGSGMILGVAIYPLLKGTNLKWVLGVIVIVFSARELISLRKGESSAMQPPKWVSVCCQFLAGIIHAVYITGGPLVVYSVSRMRLDKGVFRATLCSVWVSLNMVLAVVFVLNGRINAETIKITTPLIMVLPFGVVLGEWIHDRFKPKMFQIIIYALLIAAGLKLVIS